jgi:hypothetical protein
MVFLSRMASHPLDLEPFPGHAATCNSHRYLEHHTRPLYPAWMRSPITRIARALFVSAAAFCLFLLPRVGSTSPGDLDPTFGAGGKVTTDFRGFYDGGSAAVLQSDGKIVVAGGHTATL